MTPVDGGGNRAIRQFVTAAFMMVNGGTCGVFLTCIQCYGGGDGGGGLGNFSLWPEYSAPVGAPMGEPEKDPGAGVWLREYSAGIAIVNPGATVQAVGLPPKWANCSWVDLYGQPVTDAGHVPLQPASGLVLLRACRSPTQQK